MRKVFSGGTVLIMMLRMQRALLCAAAAALLASCGSVTPPAGGSIASASSQDPDKQAAELASKGVVNADPPKVRIENKDNRKFEVHEVTIDPRKSQGTFVLCRYFMAMDEWIFQSMKENGNGTRTYVFRRLVQGPSIEVDPLKPQPVKKKTVAGKP